MGQYCEGFVTARKDSDIITGIGTRFLSNVKQNDKIIIKLSDTTTTDIFTISGVASDTELTISTPFPNDYTFRAKYAIQRNFTVNYGYPQTFLGDEIVAPFIKSDIDLIEYQFGQVHTGEYNFGKITSIYFQSEIITLQADSSVEVSVYGIPGDTDQIECTFSLKTPTESAEFVEVSSSYGNTVSIKGLKETPTDSTHMIVATLNANTEIKAECKVIVFASTRKPLTDFTVQAAFDIPLNATAAIRPLIDPADATDAVFTIEYTASEFDPNFKLKTQGRQIEVFGKALSVSPINVLIKHATCGSRTTSIKCVDGASTLQSLSFVPTSLNVKLFEDVPTVQMAFTPSLTSINKEIVFSYEYDEFATYYEIIATYNINDYTIAIQIKHKEDASLNRYYHPVTTSKIIATNPLSSKSCELVINCTYVPADSLAITNQSPVQLMVGQSVGVGTIIAPTDFSDKVVFARIFDEYPTDIISIAGEPGILNNDEFKTDYPDPVVITGLKIGTTKLYIYSRNNNRYDSINIEVIEGSIGQITDITVTDLLPNNHIIGNTGSIKVDFLPVDASNKTVNVTTTTPLLIHVYPGTFTVSQGSYLTFSPRHRQYGMANLTITTADGSDITKTIDFQINGTVCEIPVSSVGFAETGPIMMTQGEARKIMTSVLPLEASCKQVNYRVESGSAAYTTTHVRDGNTSQYASTDEYVYVIGVNGASGNVKISVYGVNNDFIGFIDIIVA